ncbi:Histidine kinase-like ATPase domain-containing protein [Halopseudomonas xinjiangensis]|uniref:Histidine kinase-like ATPase domain-containing protein n=1 Tax=Halopseudomonas xinjiangensis TaxID=487184 RepID=A0A1H1MTJ7_9GAMM|nr:fused response regulator/phosphatase [Halopseudomonas xinjiangensis]SDR89249.1 Histidine kinase-like ATPase domain-containing protein [Halopseudomonas xinjiangensis]
MGEQAQRPVASAPGLTVLVADDNPTDRMILGRLVESLGHRVLPAENGQQAVERFVAERPDLVLLDALMPVMDGFEAARQIKRSAGEDLIPIIFLTSLTETDALVSCLAAGGDDFLTKPYNPIILQAKIQAFQRMQEMHQTLQTQRDLIASQHQRMIRDQEMAKIIFDRVAHAGCLSAGNLRYLQSAYAMFNGDILLAAYKPSGGMHLLLGDFTGHGLSAAIGAMPLAEAFYAMSARGFVLRDIVAELNHKLGQILPIGIFCCAVLVEVNPGKGLVEIWNGGLPEVLILGRNGEMLHQVASSHLPLGVAKADRFDASPVVLPMAPGERLMCWTDGIIESRSQSGELFGEDRVMQVLQSFRGAPQQAFDGLLTAIEAFHGSPEDDLSLLEMVMLEPSEQRPVPAVERAHYQAAQDWRLAYTFRAASIRQHNPLPFLLEMLMEVPGLRPHAGTLFTVLSELYSNALEHGLLGLDSGWKRDSEGFTYYYSERNQRLAELTEGSINVSLDHCPDASGGRLILEVEDSGPGFSVQPAVSGEGYAGRGLALISALADSVTFSEQGSRVRVEFVWRLGHTDRHA